MRRLKLLMFVMSVLVGLCLTGCGSFPCETDAQTVTADWYAEGGPQRGMHPSWDRNHDGINDCEDDGSCDDSIDYTKARAD